MGKLALALLYIAILVFLWRSFKKAVYTGIMTFTNKFSGWITEKTVARILNQLPHNDYRVLNDLYFEIPFHAQIDHLVVSKYGIYVIETKDRGGIVEGSVGQSQWRTTYANGSSRPFFSPIKQNENHVNAIRDLIAKQGYLKYNDRHSYAVRNVVVMSDDCRIVLDGESTLWSAIDTDLAIGTVSNLMTYLTVQADESPEVFSPADIDNLETFLSTQNITDIWKRKANNRRISKKYKKNMGQRNYRDYN